MVQVVSLEQAAMAIKAFDGQYIGPGGLSSICIPAVDSAGGSSISIPGADNGFSMDSGLNTFSSDTFDMGKGAKGGKDGQPNAWQGNGKTGTGGGNVLHVQF